LHAANGAFYASHWGSSAAVASREFSGSTRPF
jgi:hypothetical protein